MSALVRVGVTHGDLAYVGKAIVVGHYEGDALLSAEAYLDRIFGGRLAVRHRFGLYPGPKETADVFWNPTRDTRGPPAAIVVGLGRGAGIAPRDLTAGVCRGALAFALESTEPGRVEGAASEPIRLASLLMGTSASGLALDDVLPAILRGVLEAAAKLEDAALDREMAIEQLEFIELYEDRAIQASRALEGLLKTPEFSRRFELRPRVAEGVGGRRRVSYSAAAGSWQWLQIVEEPDTGALRFTSLTDRARAEVSLQTTQRSLLDRFLEEARNRATDPQLGRALFSVLVPNELKTTLPDGRDLVLVVDEAAARYPWELLQEDIGDGGTPIVVGSGMVRQLATGQFRTGVVNAAGDRALVIGDPVSGMLEFPPLDGAKAEAETVAKLFRDHGFNPDALIREDARPEAVTKALYAHDYRILHLAGHGVYRYPLPAASTVAAAGASPSSKGGEASRLVTGMVLGNGVFLTPSEFEQMTVVPELVFINCCSLGNVEAVGKALESPHLLAANVGTQLIGIGVRAVVAAGWEVSDGAANLFARELYGKLFDGETFGDAVKHARRRIFDRFGDSNTWGAYQCYGDPNFRLVMRDGLDDAPQPQTAAELVVQLDDLVAGASTLSEEGRVEQLARVGRLAESTDSEWRMRPEVDAAFGHAYAQLGEFALAIERFTNAIANNDGELPLKTFEQLANLEARFAWQRWQQAEGPARVALRPTLLAQLARAREHISLAMQAGKTAERLSIAASACKREAMIALSGMESAPEAQLVEGQTLIVNAIRQMVDHYEQAYVIAVNRKAEVFYPGLNAIAGAIVLGHLPDGRALSEADNSVSPHPLDDQLVASEASARAQSGFWADVALAECKLARGLLDAGRVANGAAAADRLRQARSSIAAAYRGVLTRIGSPREMRSVLDQLDFLRLALRHGDDVGQELARVLDELREELAPVG